MLIAKEDPVQLSNIISSLTKHVAWYPSRGLGTFLTIEFGQPSLVTRDPIAKLGPDNPLGRRPARGEYHLWLQVDHWTLQSRDWSVSESDAPEIVDRRLDLLAGQHLVGLEVQTSGTTFSFEYGESLIARAGQNSSEAQWTLFRQGDGNVSLLNGGARRSEGFRTERS